VLLLLFNFYLKTSCSCHVVPQVTR